MEGAAVQGMLGRGASWRRSVDKSTSVRDQLTCSHQEISEKERLTLYNVHVYRQIHVNNNNKTNINAWPCHFFVTVCHQSQQDVNFFASVKQSNYHKRQNVRVGISYFHDYCRVILPNFDSSSSTK